MLHGIRTALSAAALAVLGVSAALPAWAGDEEAGRRLVSRWCVSCHDTGQGGSVVDIGPSFTAIANDPARTPGRLRVWLADPHPPMPNLSLSDTEIEDILAYIDTLKRPQ